MHYNDFYLKVKTAEYTQESSFTMCVGDNLLQYSPTARKCLLIMTSVTASNTNRTFPVSVAHVK